MSIADDIINGTYSGGATKKKKKQQQVTTRNTTSSKKSSVADQIISGNYKNVPIAPTVKTTTKTVKDETSVDNNTWFSSHGGGGKDFSSAGGGGRGFDEPKKRTWFTTGAFSDGYDFGDVTKTLLGTGADMSQDLARGVLKIGEGVVDTGAYAIQGGAKLSKKLKEKTSNVPLLGGLTSLIPTNKVDDISNSMEGFIKQKEKLNKIDDVMQNKEYGDFGSVTYTEKTRAVIKVQDGCDRFCSYCIIPYARGRVRSRKPESVINEVTEIAKNGIKEVVITGIHVASYGKDFKEEYRLIDLLEEINKIDGIERIRLGSIEPLLITEEFISRLVKLNKICHHFHLSLQSGCTETLKRMNRRAQMAKRRHKNK